MTTLFGKYLAVALGQRRYTPRQQRVALRRYMRLMRFQGTQKWVVAQ